MNLKKNHRFIPDFERLALKIDDIKLKQLKSFNDEINGF